MPALHPLRRLGRSSRLQWSAPVVASVLLLSGFQSLAAVVGGRSSAVYSPAHGVLSDLSKPGGCAARRSSDVLAVPGQVANKAVQSSNRRTAAGVGIFGGLSALVPPAAAAGPEITARCAFDIRFGREKVSRLRQLVIGLFGNEAPVMARTFVQACTSTYPGESGAAASYALADVKSVLKDRRISWADFKDGNMFAKTEITDDKQWVGTKTVFRPLAGDDTKTDEDNSLRHNIPGRVSMRRGGGTFDFTVAPVADATWLDETDVVIGQVLEGMDIIEDINDFAVIGSGSKPARKIRIYRSKLLA